MLLIKMRRIWQDDVTMNPRLLFLYPENLFGLLPFKGLARQIRHFDNTFGVIIKKRPGLYRVDYFWDEHLDLTMDIINKNCEELYKKCKEYEAVVAPCVGIHVGMREVKFQSPKTLEVIQERIERIREL